MSIELAAGRLKRLPVPELDRLGTHTPLATELGLVRLKARTPAPASELLMDYVRTEATQVLSHQIKVRPALPAAGHDGSSRGRGQRQPRT